MVFETPVYFNFILIRDIGDEEFYIYEIEAALLYRLLYFAYEDI